MWSSGNELGESGEAVLLFSPSSEKRTAGLQSAASSRDDSSSSFIGGRPSYFASDALLRAHLEGSKGGSFCSICNAPMHLIAQINAPVDGLDRTLYVFGCNSAKCWKEAGASASETEGMMKDENKDCAESNFILGGAGVLRCLRSQCVFAEESEASISSAALPQSTGVEATINSSCPVIHGGWKDDDVKESEQEVDLDWENNSWGEEDEMDSMEDLEAMLSACEVKVQEKVSGIKERKKSSTETTQKAPMSVDSVGGEQAPEDLHQRAFPKFHLDIYDEPYVTRAGANVPIFDGDDDDDDDDQIGVETYESEEKIQKLLSNYLQEEEDQDILSALGGSGKDSGGNGELSGGGNGSSGGGGGGGGRGGGEKYERLPPEERAFLAFTDRIRRSPKQVVRYAYRGTPLWSIPTPMNSVRRPRGKKRNGSNTRPSFPFVLPCSCGADRTFEMQIMPSTLFALDVDAQASRKEKNANNNVEWKLANEINNGGMDWGCLAVYSCPYSCDSSREEYIIAQRSTDFSPAKREFQVPSDGSFAPNEEGGNASFDEAT